MKKVTGVAEYKKEIKSLEVKEKFLELEKIVLEIFEKEFKKKEVELVYKIAWRMPFWYLNKKMFFAIGAFKNHVSFFPYSGSLLSNFGKELIDYEYGKATVKIKLDQKIPKSLISKIVKYRISEFSK
jgi:uncharacterized protein YdhG (YjbR/CyaY superfamily)